MIYGGCIGAYSGGDLWFFSGISSWVCFSFMEGRRAREANFIYRVGLDWVLGRAFNQQPNGMDLPEYRSIAYRHRGAWVHPISFRGALVKS